MQLVNEENVGEDLFVTLIGASKGQTNYYMRMELCHTDLDHYIKVWGGFLQENEARIIVAKVVKGIKVMNEK
jgi:hypothetical protein